MPNKNKLSIYLIKENLINIEDIFDKPNELCSYWIHYLTNQKFIIKHRTFMNPRG